MLLVQKSSILPFTIWNTYYWTKNSYLSTNLARNKFNREGYFSLIYNGLIYTYSIIYYYKPHLLFMSDIFHSLHYIYVYLYWALVVELLLTSGYSYGIFLAIYVHNIRGTGSHRFFAMQFLSKIWVPMMYPLLMY